MIRIINRTPPLRVLEIINDEVKFIRKNVKYVNTYSFMSPEDVLQFGGGDCHDQASLFASWCKEQGIRCERIFCMAYDSTKGKWYDQPYGPTRTCCIVILDDMRYWVETAWEPNIGVHGPYNSIASAKNQIRLSWKLPWRYNAVHMAKLKPVPYGVTLEEYTKLQIPATKRVDTNDSGKCSKLTTDSGVEVKD